MPNHALRRPGWDAEPAAGPAAEAVPLVPRDAADCNGDGEYNILDFVCYQGKFTAGDPDADCNDDGVLNILDFVCFQVLFTSCAG